MKSLAIGRDDFKHIIENDSYYIDKTKFIEEILKDTSMVKLITRSRRFGKALNMSTLKYFLMIQKKEGNKKLFNNLYIEKSRYIEQQGQYPVIFLSLKSLTNFLYKHYTKKVILLIEEYDTPLIDAFKNGYYEEASIFF